MIELVNFLKLSDNKTTLLFGLVCAKSVLKFVGGKYTFIFFNEKLFLINSKGETKSLSAVTKITLSTIFKAQSPIRCVAILTSVLFSSGFVK